MRARWTIQVCSDECKYWKVVNTIRRGEFTDLCDHPDNATKLCAREFCPRIVEEESCCKDYGL